MPKILVNKPIAWQTKACSGDSGEKQQSKVFVEKTNKQLIFIGFDLLKADQFIGSMKKAEKKLLSVCALHVNNYLWTIIQIP